ncbi:MAG: zinc-binding dehydrogenase [Planctomycetota bacterium]|nr:zinc-binding dehydrogenase [Planctomycetota bacterium]
MDTNPTVVFPEPKKAVIEDRPLPSPAAGELLIKTSRTLISTGTELTSYSGDFPEKSRWAGYIRYPFLPGYDNVGKVVEAASDVDRKWVGKRVANYGQHARYVTAPVDSVVEIPADVPDEQAAFFTIAQFTMNGVRRGGVTWGQSVVIYGMGLLGQLTARFVRIAGAHHIFAVDVAVQRLSLVADGVTTINAAKQSAADVVRRQTHGRMADVVFEVTGNADLIPSEFEPLRQEGKFVVLSSPRKATSFDFHDLCNAPSFQIIGAHTMSHPAHETPATPWTTKRHVELFLDYLAQGEMDIGNLISHRQTHTEAPQLYEMLLKDRSGAMGVVLTWDQP